MNEVQNKNKKNIFKFLFVFEVKNKPMIYTMT
jgi:hypothetical protein